MIVKKDYKDYNPTTPSFEIITVLVREVFGTYFLEEGVWNFPEEEHVIGRTYFADRKKVKNAVNDKTVDNLILIYELAFHGRSSNDPIRISENLVRVLKAQYNIDVSYAMFFDDDTAQLRSAKIRTLRALIREISCFALNRELIDISFLDHETSFIRFKLLTSIVRHCHGTYTETVIKAMDRRTINFLL